jgi:hypothetical protein
VRRAISRQEKSGAWSGARSSEGDGSVQVREKTSFTNAALELQSMYANGNSFLSMYWRIFTPNLTTSSLVLVGINVFVDCFQGGVGRSESTSRNPQVARKF